MPQVPSKVWTPYAVLSAARELAKTVDQKRVMSEQGRMFYRLALSEIVALLNSSADPSYWGATVLTITADHEILNDNLVFSGVLTALATSAGVVTVTRNSGTFAVGEILNTTLFRSAGSLLWQGVAIVTSGGATATATQITGNSGTYAGAGDILSVIGIKSLSTSSADISTIKYDNIVAIHSSNAGFCIPVSPSEYFSVGRSDFSHKSYEDDVIWTQMGNTIYFRVGSKLVSGMGTVTMYYQRQPNYPATDAEYISTTVYVDLADKWVPLLVKRIYTYCILQVENDIPKNLAQEMQLDYQQISAYAGAELQNKMQKDLAKQNQSR